MCVTRLGDDSPMSLLFAPHTPERYGQKASSIILADEKADNTQKGNRCLFFLFILELCTGTGLNA
jgi:hypothetical protein